MCKYLKWRIMEQTKLKQSKSMFLELCEFFVYLRFVTEHVFCVSRDRG